MQASSHAAAVTGATILAWALLVGVVRFERNLGTKMGIFSKRRIASLNAASSEPTVRLLVLENGTLGSEIAAWLPPSPQGLNEDTVVLQQSATDLPATAALKVIHRLSALQRSGRKIGRSLLLVAPDIDAKRMAARHLVACALCSVSAEVVIATDANASVGIRTQLARLVTELTGENGHQNVPVTLW